eukprot:9486936-Pyramimonas_sp.AAC.1
MAEAGAVFKMRSALGNTFMREVSKPGTKLHDDWQACGQDQKEITAFKKKWASEKFSELTRKHKDRIDSYDESLVKKGRLLSVLRMCFEEGGPTGHQDAETVASVYGIAQRCLELGHPYAQLDPQSQTVKFLYFELQWRERFTKRWQTR